MTLDNIDMPIPSFVQRSIFYADGNLIEQIADRVERLCRRAVAAMEIDLTDVKVLTETATGPFAVTPVLAALAGSKEVVAVARSSRWGKASNAIAAGSVLADRCGVRDRIQFTDKPANEVAYGCDLVTNLGFVRPIDRSIISKLSRVSAVSLMWEPWEFRSSDIDIGALKEYQIALVATNEQHPEVATFRYLGPTVARLLLDVGVELVNAKFLVVGSDPFGKHIADWISAAGGEVTRELSESCNHLDAVIVAEHRNPTPLFAETADEILIRLAAEGTVVINLCGVFDHKRMARCGLSVYPNVEVDYGVMTLTTAYAGPRPVIDLHAAGLKAGAEVVRARKRGLSIEDAVSIATKTGYGLPILENSHAVN